MYRVLGRYTDLSSQTTYVPHTQTIHFYLFFKIRNIDRPYIFPITTFHMLLKDTYLFWLCLQCIDVFLKYLMKVISSFLMNDECSLVLKEIITLSAIVSYWWQIKTTIRLQLLYLLLFVVWRMNLIRKIECLLSCT